MICSRLAGTLAVLAVLISTGGLALPGSALAAVAPTCSPSAQTVSHGRPVTLAPSCVDPDGQPMSYFFAGQSDDTAGMTTNATDGTMLYSPVNGYRGEFTVYYFAYETGARGMNPHSSFTSIDVTVTDAAPDCAITDSPDKQVSHAAQTTFDFTCTDADGDAITPAVIGAAHGDAVISSPGVITYTPSAGSSYTGGDEFFLHASEDVEGAISPLLALDVTITDTAPVCVQPGTPPTIHAGTTTTLSYSCADADGDRVEVEGFQANHGSVTLSGTDGEVDFHSAGGFAGLQTILLVVDETDSPLVTAQFTATATTTDTAPVCSGSMTNVAHGQTATGTVSCSDAEGDPFTVQIVAGSTTGGIKSLSGSTITYHSLATESGTKTVEVSAVSDDNPAFRSPVTAINFNVTNAAPTCTQTSSTAQITLGTAISTASLPFSCTDADGDPLTLTLSSLDTHGQSTLGAQSASYSAESAGSDTLTLSADDGFVSSTLRWTITVLPITPVIVSPPVVEPPPIVPVVTPDPIVTLPVVVTPPVATGPSRLEVEKPGALAQNVLSVSISCPAAMGKVCNAFVRPSGKGYVRSLGARAVTIKLGTSSAFKLTIPSYAAQTLRAYAGKNLRFIVTVTTRDSLGETISVRKQIVVHIPR